MFPVALLFFPLLSFSNTVEIPLLGTIQCCPWFSELADMNAQSRMWKEDWVGTYFCCQGMLCRDIHSSAVFQASFKGSKLLHVHAVPSTSCNGKLPKTSLWKSSTPYLIYTQWRSLRKNREISLRSLYLDLDCLRCFIFDGNILSCLQNLRTTLYWRHWFCQRINIKVNFM